MISCFGVLACGLAGFHPSLPPPPPPPLPVEWLIIKEDVPRVRDALGWADQLGYHSSCTSLTVGIVDGDDNRSWAWASGPGTPCGIDIDTDVATDTGWYGDYSAYHEVAHIITVGEPGTHGPRFRQVEAALLAKVGLEVRYLTDQEYPDEYWQAGICVYGC